MYDLMGFDRITGDRIDGVIVSCKISIPVHDHRTSFNRMS
ncbi:hypothetical protein B488_07660 [Liberibacter crescens BT-1]|uniref:Uncharacterized protein n=1 Tax=Liberibacter crescens (strain BT-1) TaxID=1215343 RepID=L0EVQ8_LIBCB|nr:hypothetical protein B488_07660 [Liberibacter crescens BT-1]